MNAAHVLGSELAYSCQTVEFCRIQIKVLEYLNRTFKRSLVLVTASVIIQPAFLAEQPVTIALWL